MALATSRREQAANRRDVVVGALISLLLRFFGRQLTDDRLTPVDSERWNDELASDLFFLARDVVSREGEIEINRFMGSGFDVELAHNYLMKGAVLTAQNINASTSDLIDEAVAGGRSEKVARDSILDGPASYDRASSIANGKAQTLQAFSSLEAAKQRGGEYFKTWIGSGHPESRHKDVWGQSVPVSGTFSNGLRFPGDPSADIDQTAGCKCSLEVNGGPTL